MERAQRDRTLRAQDLGHATVTASDAQCCILAHGHAWEMAKKRAWWRKTVSALQYESIASNIQLRPRLCE